MNFRPELAAKVMDGSKTVTRRRMNVNPRSPWNAAQCSLVVGQDYAVCPGRGKHAIGRATVTAVSRAVLGDVDDHEARLEGFPTRDEFITAWRAINGTWAPLEQVWRVVFEVAS